MPPRFVLGKGHIQRLNGAVDTVFDRLTARTLGGDFMPKQLGITVKKPLTIPGIFQAAGHAEGRRPDQSLLDPVLEMAKGYLDAQRERTKAKLIHTVQSFLHNAHDQGVDANFDDVLTGQILEAFGDAKRNVKRIVATETNTAKNTSLLDSVIKANAENNVDDPVVAWLCVHDTSLCEECRKLHLLDDEKTPRVWLLSECGHEYHKPGDPSPKVGGLHPNDRCTLITVLPGYGFRDGSISFIGFDHRELEYQRRAPQPDAELSAE